MARQVQAGSEAGAAAGSGVLIRRAEIAGRSPLDVRIRGEHIEEVATALRPKPAERVIDAGGGALLPGLHDHHIHLLSLAASLRSVHCGPPKVRNRVELASALREAPTQEEWLRGVGYHESVAGSLDRFELDALIPERPVRIQHRTGALWTLNSAALARLDLSPTDDPPGLERDPKGLPTGRLYRADRWLRERLGRRERPDLRVVGRALASFGVTGVTDATVSNGPEELRLFAEASGSGELPQRLLLMGGTTLPEVDQPGLERGPVKFVLAEAELPQLDELRSAIDAAHARSRAVAIHCVTRAELVTALAALADAGTMAGDRIEHASVAPPELAEKIAELELTVVTQPNFVRERGDAYLRDVEAPDRPWLYRCKGLLDAGVALGGGTDAPFGDPDPWRAIQAAVDRRSEAGVRLAPAEALTPERALALFTSAPQAPGGEARAVAVGAAADLCLLDRPWSAGRGELRSDLVALTLLRGEVIFSADAG